MNPITPAEVPVSVWATGQKPSQVQRRGRYLPESMKHPGKMLPAIAARTIATYTRTGEYVLDPMCGIGTTLVEAAHLGRNGIGVEYERRWAQMAAANLHLAHRQGATGSGLVIGGDSRRIIRLVPEQVRGRIALVLTSPPYGSSTHGHVCSTRDSGEDGVTKQNNRYSTDRDNLAHRRLPDLLEGFGQILDGCAELLVPGGVVAVTVRPIRVKGELIDLPGQVVQTAERSGLVLVDQLVALLCGLRDGRLVNRASFFQKLEARRARDRGVPACATAHEDLLIFHRACDLPGSPR
ncbi:site-specific DNA-methyltransferase [Actinomadura craniellae]|uniref:Methyltransferase n=1 Tax=Actinomadura craniellae TaxID=2231787 RepID=A0A365HAW2_9ACTN|nr:DNA methyltransferase [Actinomadura craniellae]RAY15403.1 site-specific DNA-methyltransferase [Actinomadura craniellae]